VSSTVFYSHSFPYSFDPVSGRTFPGLPIQISLQGNSDGVIETYAQLDSGAEFSIFDGKSIVQGLGLELMSGREITLASSAGFSLSARIHKVHVFNTDLGGFTYEVALSTVPIRRNLLGRDFFQHLQIGFREFHHTFLIANAP
jgi:hypothetical protein